MNPQIIGQMITNWRDRQTLNTWACLFSRFHKI